MLALALPTVDWELTIVGVIVLGLLLPTLEWAFIAFGTISLGKAVQRAG